MNSAGAAGTDGEGLVLRLLPPPFWTPAFALNFAGGVVAAVVIGAAMLRLKLAHGIPIPPVVWALFAGVAGATVVGTIAWGLGRPRRVPDIEFGREALRLPRSRLARKPARVPYARVYSLQTLGRRAFRRLVLEGAGAWPIRIPERAFASEEGPSRFAEELQRAIRALPDGAERIARLEHRSRVGERAREGLPWVSGAAVAALLLVFGIEWARGATRSLPTLLSLGANSPVLVREGEWFRLVTANFLHANLLHLYGNALALAVFGGLVERLLGTARLLLLLLCSAFAGAAASYLWDGHPLSVGASTAAFGVLAGLAYLNVFYRDDLPWPLRLPGWWWAAVAALGLVGEFAIPHVDHAAHVGGAAAGCAVMAWSCRGVPILQLREGAFALRLAAAVFLALFAVAGSQGVWNTWRGQRDPGLQLAEVMLQSPGATPVLWNDAAWQVATTATTPSRDQLELARRGIERALEAEPDTPAFLDTQATVAYRMGDLDRAVEIERTLLERVDERLFASQLARFEWARFRREGGPLRIGEGSDVSVSLGIEPGASGDPGDTALVMRLAEKVPAVLELHAVALWNERIAAHLRLLHDGRSGRVQRLAALDPALPELGEELRFEVVLIDTARDRPDRDCCGWRFWGMDPEIAGLP